MSKYFPYNYIPSLPEKTEEYLLKEENQPKIISYLHLFLNAIISKEELKAYEGIFCFLTIKDYNEYKNKLKEITSTPPPLNVEDTLSLDGTKTFQELNDDDYNNNYDLYCQGCYATDEDKIICFIFSGITEYEVKGKKK